MSYPLIELEKICTDVYSGGTPSSGNEDYYGGDIPWLRTQEVVFNNIWDTEIRITETGLKNSSAKLVPENSVIVAMYGNSAGRVAVNKIPLTTNQACCNLLINEDLADYRYIFYSLKHNYLALKSQAKGAAQNNLNASQVKGFKVPMPDKNAQIEIANILSNYDDFIENNKRRIALLEESARLLYREWFVHFRFPGHEHVKIIDGLPEGWSELKIEEVGEVVTGKTPSTKKSNYYGGLIPFVKTPDMHGNVYVLNTDQTLTEEGAATQANKFIPKDSLIVSCIGTLGVVAISATDCQTNQQINSVVPFDSNHNLYLYFTFKMLKPRLEAMGGGATMGNVNKSKFSSLNIVMPSGFLLNAFKDFADPVFQQILILQKQNQKLTQARDILLPRLMNGDLAV